MDLDDTASLDHQSFDSTFNSVPFTSTLLKEGRHTSLAEISGTLYTSLETLQKSTKLHQPFKALISCYGMKLVGYNLNVTVTPRDMRSDRQKC